MRSLDEIDVVRMGVAVGCRYVVERVRLLGCDGGADDASECVGTI